MTATELLAMAEDALTLSYETCNDPVAMGALRDKAVYLAEHIQATVRPDDDEPVTYRKALKIGVNWLGWKYDHKTGSKTVGVINRPDGTQLEIETMGQLRALLRALGMEAKEQS
mgnify:CR=1 FL=1